MGALPARPAPPAAPEPPPAPAVPGLPPAPAPSLNVRNCKHCGKEFTVRHYSNAYCSGECSKTAHKIARLGDEKPVTLDSIPSHSSPPGEDEDDRDFPFEDSFPRFTD
jgi:hypothetical protein